MALSNRAPAGFKAMGGGWRYTQRQPLLTTCRLQALDHPGVYPLGTEVRGAWSGHHRHRHPVSAPSRAEPKGLYFCREIQQLPGVSEVAFKTTPGTFRLAFAGIYLQSNNRCQRTTKSAK